MALEQPTELEGTWEEILMHANQLVGRRVRVTVLSDQDSHKDLEQSSTAASLLKFAGQWAGDDLEECLRLVYETRSQTKFD